MRNTLSKSDFELFAVVSWNIWFNRNRAIRGEQEPDPGAFFKWCFNFWESFAKARVGSGGVSTGKAPIIWAPPSEGTFKINVDAGEVSGDDSWRVAAVVRNWAGEVVRWSVRHVQQPLSPLAEELLAVKEGVRLGCGLNLQQFCVESDCASAVSLLKNQTQGCSDMDGVIRDIMLASENGGCKSFCYVNRKANSLAHNLAKRTPCIAGNVFSSDVIPFSFLSFVDGRVAVNNVS